MVDATQFLLVFVIVVITIMLSAISVQVFFILREFRKTIMKANKVLEDTGVITESFSKPINMISGMLVGLKGGSAIVKSLTKDKNVRKE